MSDLYVHITVIKFYTHYVSTIARVTKTFHSALFTPFLSSVTGCVRYSYRLRF